MLRGESDKVLKRIIGLIPLCLALFILPSLALDDMAPLDSVYQIQDDASLLSLTPYSLSPLSTTTPTYWSSSDINTVVGSNNSIYRTVNEIYNKVNNSNDYIFDIRQAIPPIAANVSDIEIYNKEISGKITGIFSFLQEVYTADGSLLRDYLPEFYSDLNSISALLSSGLKVDLGFPDGSSLFTGQGESFGNNYLVYSGRGSDRKQIGANFYSILSMIYEGVYQVNWNGSDGAWLSRYGTVWNDDGGLSLGLLTNHGFLGLASILRGDSAVLSGSILNSSDLSVSSVNFSSILSAFSPLFNLQNDVARLTHVIADPTEQALHDATKDDIQAVTDNLTGSNGVTPSAVGDVAGISSGVGDFMESGVDSSRLSDSLSDSSNFSFFSQQTANDLDTVPSVLADYIEDYIDFYALNREAYMIELGGD